MIIFHLQVSSGLRPVFIRQYLGEYIVYNIEFSLEEYVSINTSIISHPAFIPNIGSYFRKHLAIQTPTMWEEFLEKAPADAPGPALRIQLYSRRRRVTYI